MIKGLKGSDNASAVGDHCDNSYEQIKFHRQLSSQDCSVRSDSVSTDTDLLL